MTDEQKKATLGASTYTEKILKNLDEKAEKEGSNVPHIIHRRGEYTLEEFTFPQCLSYSPILSDFEIDPRYAEAQRYIHSQNFGILTYICRAC